MGNRSERRSKMIVKFGNLIQPRHSEDPYDAYEMGFDRGLADVRKVIKEEL